ncbi:hypothetical protein GQ42DRAFT_158844 [Ramicandelaber brevisporus]|nr:hypothetical protein GQ42DRAFT_158844 [Ramicandelaber brevisporus]
MKPTTLSLQVLVLLFLLQLPFVLSARTARCTGNRLPGRFQHPGHNARGANCCSYSTDGSFAFACPAQHQWRNIYAFTGTMQNTQVTSGDWKRGRKCQIQGRRNQEYKSNKQLAHEQRRNQQVKKIKLKWIRHSSIFIWHSQWLVIGQCVGTNPALPSTA